MADNRDEFSEKVLAKLKEKNRAIDLTEEEIVESAKSEPEIVAQSEPAPDQNFVAFDATGAAPTSGGNKDILIIPGFGGTTAASASQINFYWIEPATVPTDNVTDATGTTRRSTLFNYSDDLNNPAIAFGGYNGTLNLAPASTYGGSTTNTVAKIWIHPFSGTIDADYLDLGNNTVAAATTAGILSWVPGSTRLSVGDGTNAKQIAYTTDVTSANSITATLDTTDTDLFPLFVNLVGDGTSNQTVKTGGTTASMLMNATNGNITIQGDLAINGGDLTSTATTFNMLTGTSTTVNAFTAATALGLGASTGTTSINNTTVSFPNATVISGSTGLATVFSAANPASLAVFGAATTATIFGAATSLTMGATSGTGTFRNATIDFPNATTISGSSGLATVFSSANPSSLAVFGAATTATAYASATTLGIGSTAGTASIRNATISFPNATTISGSSGLATVFSAANPSSLAVFGAATTATIFGAATTLGIGSSTGTTSINNTTVSFPNATTISGSSALASVFATANPSSLAVFGAATTFSLGSSTGTGSINNTTVSFPNATTISGSSALATVFSAANPSSLAVFGSATTATIFGAATTLGIGSSAGTASINNTTVSFPNATTISGSSALATVFSAANPSSLAVFGSATTATILGAATTLSIGSTAGTVTVANATATFSGTTANFSANTNFNLGTSVTGASTTNIGTGAVAGQIKAINIGTGGSGTGTSTIIIGTTSGTSTITLNGVTTLSTALAVGSGGTGTSTAPTQWGVIFATSTSAYNSTAAGSANQWLRAVNSGAPTWSTATLATTYSQYDLVYASASNTVGGLANTSTSVLVSQTAGPAWLQGGTGNRILKTSGTAISWSQVDLSSGDVTGTLAVGSGGTGLTSYTVDGIVYATGSTTLASSANFKFNAGTTSGSGTTSAHYVNTAVTTGTAMYLAAPALASGNGLIINAGSGSFTSGKLIDAQNNGSSKFSIDFNGNLRATTKSFDIEHPTKPGKRLVYGVLEGPEHGVYHRGTAEGKGLLKIELPEYWHKLVGEDYSIQLTPWGNYAVHIVEKTENYFIIQLSGNFISQKFKNIKVDYIIHGSRTDAPLEIEQD